MIIMKLIYKYNSTFFTLIGAKIILFEDNDPSLTRKHMPTT